MLEQQLIFSRGGLILWCNQISNAVKGSPIDALIHSFSLKEHSANVAFSYDTPGALYTLKWAFDNRSSSSPSTSGFSTSSSLAVTSPTFADIYDPKRTAYPSFDEVFGWLQREAEARAVELKKSKQVGKLALPAASAKKNGDARSGLGNIKKKGGVGNGKNSSNGSGSDDHDGNQGGTLQMVLTGMRMESRTPLVVNNTDTTVPVGVAFDQDKIQKLIKGSNIVDEKGGKKKREAIPRIKSSKAEPKKENQVWVDDKPKEGVKLDMTNHADVKGVGLLSRSRLQQRSWVRVGWIRKAKVARARKKRQRSWRATSLV